MLAPAVSREYMRWVQTRLNDILDLRLPIDGVLGPATRSAIRDFQRREGLPVSGTVGPETERALAQGGAAPMTQDSADGSDRAEGSSTQEAAQIDEEISMISKGLIYARVGLELSKGERDENRLTSIGFFTLHPERNGAPISKSEPDFDALSAEWIEIRNTIVRPLIRKTSSGASGRTSTGRLPLVATPIPTSTAYSHSGSAARYGLPETISALQWIGEEWHQLYPQVAFRVRDISLEGGGKFRPHKSHRIGLDADVQLLVGGQKVAMGHAKYPEWRGYVQALVDLIRRNPILPIKTIGYSDTKVKGVSNWKGHTQHLHIRFCMPAKYRSQLDLSRVYGPGETKPDYTSKCAG